MEFEDQENMNMHDQVASLRIRDIK